jgi:TatD DNase family protein
LNTSQITIIDTHAHLDADEFTVDCDAVVARAVEAGVQRIITCGTGVESSEKVIALADKFPQVYAAVGFHPQECQGVQQSDILRIAELAKYAKVVALGEMGLDFHRPGADRDQQIQILKWQLDLADELKLPVIIHNRQATGEMIHILNDWITKSHIQTPGVIHCFQENITNARIFLEMGFYLAFGGYIGYPNSRLQEVIKSIPENRLLVETDCPYLPPQKYRGKRNEPSYIIFTVEKMAEILETTAEQVGKQTTENAMRLFKL